MKRMIGLFMCRSVFVCSVAARTTKLRVAYPTTVGSMAALWMTKEAKLFEKHGLNLEPLDGRGQLVDMNGNGQRDRRETVEQAWRRIGLLKNHESMSRSKYVECITRAANAIAREGLLPARMVNYYASKARRALSVNRCVECGQIISTVNPANFSSEKNRH